MLRVFVLGKNQDPLMPCHPARARKLLALAKARVFKLHPFTIILTEREEGVTQEVEQKIDPGSRTTGISLVASFKEQTQVIFALSLTEETKKPLKQLCREQGVEDYYASIAKRVREGEPVKKAISRYLN